MFTGIRIRGPTRRTVSAAWFGRVYLTDDKSQILKACFGTALLSTDI